MPIDPYTGEEIGNLPRLTVRPNPLPVEAYDPYSGMAYPDQPQQDYSAVNPTVARLFGVGGYDRFQTWPERMVRSGASLPADVYSGEEPILDASGHTAQKVIERAQDTSGMAGMSSIPLAPKGALGALGGKFYSTLENTIANSKVQKGTPEQWQAYLKNQPGIKPEELEFSLSGLGEGIVTKEQLTNHVAENGIKLGEVWKGDKTVNPKLLELDNKARAFEREGNTEAARAVRQEILSLESDGVGRPKFSSYQLPGGENYRELLLTVPKQENFGVKQAEGGYRLFDYKTNDFVRTPDGKVRMPYQTMEEAQIAAKGLNDTSGLNPMGNYQSSHWDEPNVLAHIRMNDRQISNGTGYQVINTKSGNTSKVFDTQAEAEAMSKTIPNTKVTEANKPPLKTLHIEEIQSDWHQAGRKQGYKGDAAKLKPEVDKIIAEKLEPNKDFLPSNLVDPNTKTINPENFSEHQLGFWQNQKVLTADEVNKIKNYQKSLSGTPDAPFKKTWDELALKRAITEAAHNGYDAVSWTPGEAQAARYDLSKHVDNIELMPLEKGNRHIILNAKSGVHASGEFDPSGKLIKGYDAFRGNEGKPLSDLIGKEIAEKIMSKDISIPSRPTELPKGYELIKDGDKWGITPPNQNHARSMVGLHSSKDEAIRQAINLIHSEMAQKPHRVENVDLKIGGEGMKAFYDTMLPAKANALIKKMGGKVEYETLPGDGRNYYVEPVTLRKLSGGGERATTYDVRWKDPNGQEKFNANYTSKEEAEAKVKELNNKKGDKIPLIRITPQMREKITKEGFPLYSSGVPNFTPVDDPFKKKEPKLVPVDFNPFTNRNAT